MTIDFQPIYTSYKNDQEVSEVMIKKVLEIVPKASDFYDSVRDRMTTHCKSFMILPARIERACALFEDNTLYIKFRYQVNSDEFPCTARCLSVDSVSCSSHHYTARQERRGFAPRIIEVFSHPHCRKIAAAWGLSELEGKYRSKSAISARLKFKYTEKYHRDWECILNIVWTLSTFPEMYERRVELNGYETYKDSIEELLSIVQSIDTMINTPQEVFTCMEAVVEKLVLRGMPRIKVQYPF